MLYLGKNCLLGELWRGDGEDGALELLEDALGGLDVSNHQIVANLQEQPDITVDETRIS